MAWRFGDGNWVKEGYLYLNGDDGIAGSIEMAGIGDVTFYLNGQVPEIIRNGRLSFSNSGYKPRYVFHHSKERSSSAHQYMADFDRIQSGRLYNLSVEDAFGLEWYSNENGFCEIVLPEFSYYVE